jgi:signal transduction histidine kinase
MTGIRAENWQDADGNLITADDEGLRIRGLLHDLGHQMMTLSLLTESVRADSATPDDSRARMKLVLHEMFRAMDLISGVMPDDPARQAEDQACVVDIRDLAGEVAELADLAYEASVTVQPGSPARLQVGPCLLWRVLTNLVGNAVRAAGPAGAVTIAVDQRLDTVIEIADDGPGFGRGPAGTSGLGMSVVRQLLDTAGGRLDIEDRTGGGTRARVVFSLEREYSAGPAATGPWH